MKKNGVAIILGGGRYNNDELTPLSIQRLDRGYKLYQKKKVSKLVTLGGYYSTYSPRAIKFDKSGAQLRKEYLVTLGVKNKDIIKIENGRDTICEAFAAREQLTKLKHTNLILITSDKHMNRALWVFKRIFGKPLPVIGEKVPCGDILIPKEEKEYFEATKQFFEKLSPSIPTPNLSTWFKDNAKLYNQFKRIHDHYHPSGKESQAYTGVKHLIMLNSLKNLFIQSQRGHTSLLECLKCKLLYIINDHPAPIFFYLGKENI